MSAPSVAIWFARIQRCRSISRLPIAWWSLIDEGMDVVVRIGAPKDSGLVMRKLVDNHRIVVGAPDYLERRRAHGPR
jgi:DNA-binding transcriptional LysR family regulator